MAQMDRVLWTKGLLLTPQHMQLQDRYLEDLVAFEIFAFSLNPWGFIRLELDRDALAAGSLAVSRAAGLMPDGLPFDMPASDPPPAPKPLQEFWRRDHDSLDVSLGIPESRAGGRTVSMSHSDRGTRYSAEVVLRRDENTGLAEKPIQVARKNFRLLAAGESLDGYSAMPMARVTRAASGEFTLDPGFVPPLLDFTASDFLVSVIRRLTEILMAKTANLSAARRQRDAGLADFGPGDLVSFWLLYTVNSHLPRFRHFFETRRGHPSELYRAMIELASALTTFSTTLEPRELPAYDHAAPSECFRVLDEQVRLLLDTVVPAGHVTVPLREVEPSIYATPIEHDRYLAAPGLFLAVSGAAPADDLERSVPRLLKVSSRGQLQRLVRQAMPGVPLRPVPKPPGTLPLRLDCRYFALEKTGADWDAIARERNLAVFVPADIADVRLELVVILPPER